MAALELASARKSPGPQGTQRLGSLFWMAVGWLAWCLPSRLATLPLPVRPTWTCWAAGTIGRALARHRRPWARRARLIYGAQISLVSAFAHHHRAVIGGALGIWRVISAAGSKSLVVGSMDVLLAFPPLILALAVTPISGNQS
jgi:peptide/nickel transport system permease protein